MKILILYSGKTGTTKECAERLGAMFPSADLVIADTDAEPLAPRGFDYVVLGSAVRASSIRPSMKKYIGNYLSDLLDTEVGLFLCCFFPDQADTYFKKNFPPALLDKVTLRMSFGGEPRLGHQHGIDKWMVRFVLKQIENHNRDSDRDYDIPMPALIPENISRFADGIRAALLRNGSAKDN